MKILHYIPGFPPVRGGGLIKYALDLIEAESLNNDLCILAPGPISLNSAKRSYVRIKHAGNWKGIQKYQIFNPLPVPMANGIQDINWFTLCCSRTPYQQLLTNIRPDLIHIHTFMGLHEEFLKEAVHNHIPVVYTTHDYFGLCPKTDLMLGTEPCPQPGKHCAECSRNAFSSKRLILEQSNIYKLYRNTPFLIKMLQNKALSKSLFKLRSSSPLIPVDINESNNRKTNIDQSVRFEYQEDLIKYYSNMFQLITRFHFNSKVAREVFENYLGRLNGEVINISNKTIMDRRTHRTPGKCLRIGFLGGDSPYKGLLWLINIINLLYNKGFHNMELHIYGSRENREYPFCRYHKSYNTNLDEVFCSMDILAVPSIWKETFGMVVPEALSFGVPVIISDKVGAKDILVKSEKPLGLIIPVSEQAWIETIKKIYLNREIIKLMNENIVNAKLDLKYQNHLCHIMKFYRETIELSQKSSIVNL